jgi:predicted dehydrogenase/nucleoside-diphosphate-sugar epimerase
MEVSEKLVSNGSNASMGSGDRADNRVPYRVALLGAGYIAEYHAKALKALPDTKMVAVCDRAKMRAQACADSFSIPSVYTSLEEMLDREALDAVHVLLPPEAHFQCAARILEAGVATLLEKPMCTTASECAQLVELARQRNTRIGVGHNFLFSEVYERLRSDVAAGVLGPIDHVTITWNKELGQLAGGPFDLWMLREPQNILLEIGPHPVGHLLDLVGEPDEVRVSASNPVELPNGRVFCRRWQVQAYKGRTAVDINMSFVRGFTEHGIHVRGALCSATVDFERNTYVLHRHLPKDIDIDRYAVLVTEAGMLTTQARRTLGNYVAAKVVKSAKGNPYGHSIALAANAFYRSLRGPLDRRLSPELGHDIIELCERLGRAAQVPSLSPRASSTPMPVSNEQVRPSTLVLGATGFIGQALVEQMIAAGRAVRIMVRNSGKVTGSLVHPLVEVVEGNCASAGDLDLALRGMSSVVHMARAHVKTWEDYQQHEIEMTRTVAERCLKNGIQRFIYTGTIDSYYAGSSATTITEETPLDSHIERRNLYARAKAVSEGILFKMAREEKLPLIVVRPGIVIGRGSSPLHWGVGMWQYDSICQVWGEGENKLPLVLVQDVATALISCLDTPGLIGESFNLVGDPFLSANEYLDELERASGLKLTRIHTPIIQFYGISMAKWVAKVLVKHPEHILPSYRDWASRTQQARFDCTKAKRVLGWQPSAARADLVERGIAEPAREWLR